MDKLTVLGLMLLCGQISAKECPCQRPEWCNPVNITEPRKELFVFSVSNHTWKKWNWTAITTVIAFGYDDPELMCFAHAHRARYGMVVGIDPALLKNRTATKLWVDKTLSTAKDRFADAINIDTEQAIAQNSTERNLLTELVKNLTKGFKQDHPMRQVTFDLAWRPGGVDGRFYDEKGIADVVDFVFIMSYDTQSQIKTGECIAKANIPYDRIITGYTAYIRLGIPANKLVMGLPWYGYFYQCSSFDNLTDTCYIPHKPFRGVNCSDAAGSQYDFSRIVKLRHDKRAERKWSQATLTPFFDYYDNSTKKWYQVWYDDPESLEYKLQYARGMDLRGVGMWNADELDYSEDPTGKVLTHTIWSIFTEWVKTEHRDVQEETITQTRSQPHIKTSYPTSKVTRGRPFPGPTHLLPVVSSICFASSGNLAVTLIAVLIIGVIKGALITMFVYRYRQRKLFKHQPLPECEAGL